MSLLLYSYASPSPASKSSKESECQMKAPVNFSPAQRSALCGDGGGHGPSLCAITAHHLIPTMNAIDIIELCRGSLSKDGAECYYKLNPLHRKTFGKTLCRSLGNFSHVDDVFPSECFNDLIRRPGVNHLPPTEAAEYCVSLETIHGPLDCINHCINHKLVSFKRALELCRHAGSNSNATSQCLDDMKLVAASVFHLHVDSIIEFCSSALPEAYFPLTSSEPDTSDIESPLANCFKSSQKILLSSFDLKHRLRLCNNAPVFERGSGPVDCSLQLLSRSLDVKLEAQHIISLCAGAISAGPALCFIESKGLGSLEKRIDICIGAQGAGQALCYRKSHMVFKGEEESTLALCVGAQSASPALCAASGDFPLILSINPCT